MKPGYAETGEPLFQTAPVTDQWQAGMIFKMTFRATKDRPGFATYWYEGTRSDGSPVVPETPEELLSDGQKLPKTGNLVIGTKGKMLVEGDYWNKPRLIPESKAKSFGARAGTARTLPRPSRRVPHGLPWREAARVQPIELRLLRPHDGQHSARQPRGARRQETDSRPRRQDHQRSRASTTSPGASRAKAGDRWK